MKNSCYSFFLKPLTEEQILNHMRNLNPSKSSGMQGIPIKFIKPASILLAPVLTKLFNIAIEQATFPTIFKTAEVVPVYKNGSKLNCSNYRPISLLCPFSKLLEKCIYDQLYLKRNQLLYEYQFGFRKNLSTELAINQIYEDFVRGVESKEITCSVF